MDVHVHTAGCERGKCNGSIEIRSLTSSGIAHKLTTGRTARSTDFLRAAQHATASKSKQVENAISWPRSSTTTAPASSAFIGLVSPRMICMSTSRSQLIVHGDTGHSDEGSYDRAAAPSGPTSMMMSDV